MGKILGKTLFGLRVLRSRGAAAVMLAAAVSLVVLYTTEKTHAVYIRDGDDVRLDYTMKEDVQEVLKENGIHIRETDEVRYTGVCEDFTEVEIERSFPVTVTLGNFTREFEVAGGTVKDLLDAQGIHLNYHDIINMDLDEQLRAGCHITVQRVEYDTREEERELPYHTVETRSSLLKPGSKKVLTWGKMGSELVTFDQKRVNGEIIFELAVESETVKDPVAQKELVGAKTAISPLDFDCDFDENEEPIDYVTVYRNQKATGYSAPSGAKTASGRTAGPGYVAVDPDEIPYGTKLYIVSPDKSFIYGYAIAADTGTGLQADMTDIDLCYNSYMESVLNSARTVDIYVLD